MLRNPSQIGVREKYLIATRIVSGESGVGANGVAAFEVDSGEYVTIGAVALASAVTTASGYAKVSVSKGNLYRDLGRSITVVDADGNHLALYRNVQLVSGSTTEGVPGDADYSANIYVRVWADDGTNVVVARLG